ncbi:MAG TPA: hypothetical protein VJK51_03825 [Candidatus Nanoarchaeia archaeon]|nr:hypothetical protein [Candidatus Nanoarchaeia archaeon]
MNYPIAASCGVTPRQECRKEDFLSQTKAVVKMYQEQIPISILVTEPVQTKCNVWYKPCGEYQIYL